MPSYTYDRLTALDYSFLALEKPNAYMHVASTQIYDAGPMRLEDGGIDAEKFRKLTAAAIHQIPRYRQKLAYIPIENHPVWVDDPDFNIDYHLRHTALPPARLGRAAEAAVRAHHAAAPRSLAAAVGDVARRGARGRPLRRHLEGAPLHDRRRLRRRPDEDPDERDTGAGHPARAGVHPAAGAQRPRPAARRGRAPGAPAVPGDPRRAPLPERGDGRAARVLGARAGSGGHAGSDHAARLRDAAQPRDRPAPPVRLARHGPGRDEAGATRARRLAQRRRADGRQPEPSAASSRSARWICPSSTSG